MRTSTDPCLLCSEKQAEQKNSHIVPKFMTKRILGKEVKRVHHLNTSRSDENIPFSQDTHKEDFLFCPNCETYFCLLETIVSSVLENTLKEGRGPKSNYVVRQSYGQSCLLEFVELNKGAFYLFIYSIIYRVAMSEFSTFDQFKLAAYELAFVREELRKCRGMSKNDILMNGGVISINCNLSTPAEILSSESDMVFVVPTRTDRQQLFLGEYLLDFSFKDLDGYYNTRKSQNVLITTLSSEVWSTLKRDITNYAATAFIADLQMKGLPIEIKFKS